MKINILDKSIFNRIAAGEVVERPASVVKELVENSIDAGATNITIEIVDGGIKKIKVIDNGCGIEHDELPKAFMPHATSKIATLEDLEKIGTLGFRGEALASISSVAKVTVVTKTKDSELGSKFEIHGGEVVSHIQTGATDGTTISVEDIFYCVPARAKFLKKPKQEEAEITNIVTRLILANPNIVVKYVVNDRIVFLSQGNGLKEAIYTVYGKNTVDNVIEINYERDIFKVTGYIGKPTYTKPNRTYQTLLINGRYVINQTISAAMHKAYEGFLMKGNFPFFVMNLEIPLDKVDVNVHPNKLDVKFEESNKIFGIILSAVSKTLLESTLIKTLENNYEDEIIAPKPVNLHVIQENSGILYGESKLKEAEVSEPLKDVSNSSELFNAKKESLNYFLNKNETDFSNFTINSDLGFSKNLVEHAIKTENVIVEESKPVQHENISLFTDEPIKIIGILFNTYIVVQQGENAYFIDQHAAHERVLYDRFKEQLIKKEIHTQQLLVPYILDTNYLESEFINNNIENLKQLGFEVEIFGSNSFKVSTVPVLFKDFSINEFFTLILKDINNMLVLKPERILENYLARSACRTAIKANDIIGEKEIQILLEELNKNNQVLLCPHGRPIVVSVPRKDLEKWFKRIV